MDSFYKEENFTKTTTKTISSPTGINYCKLEGFLNSIFYQNWNSFLRWEYVKLENYYLI